MRDHRKTPLFRKAEEIRELAEAIVESAPDQAAQAENRFLTHMLEANKNEIMANAFTIEAKIAGAYGMGLYDLQMENACLIRRSCREMVVALRGLEMAGHNEQAHFDLLRKAVDEFRPLFAEWVATFKDSERIWDEWGLFNLPGDMPDHD